MLVPPLPLAGQHTQLGLGSRAPRASLPHPTRPLALSPAAGHGSNVAGIVGAVGNNSIGIAGVAWRVQLLACKVFDESDFGSLSALLNCYIYCRLHGAQIMTASFAGNGERPGP